MIDMDVLISNVQQLTHLTFDEKKVEAAAVTIVEVTESMAMEEEKVIDFYLNKPFMYYIEDTNGICVFIGIINNPNWQ
jgi:serine protease inhibitor